MTHDKPIRVLVAEDSSLFADSIVAILESAPDIKVVGVATNGLMAVELTRTLAPDVVLMDVRMPVLDGLDAVQRIMAATPTRILVMTADPEGRTGTMAFEALRRGALELVPKPMTWTGTPQEQDELRGRIRMLSRIPVIAHLRRGRVGETPHPTSVDPRVARDRAPVPPSHKSDTIEPPTMPPAIDPHPDRRVRLVAMGASTGGPAALAKLIPGLPNGYPAPILIVQHLSRGFEAQLVGWLSELAAGPVLVAKHGVPLVNGSVYIAPSSAHLRVDRDMRVALDTSPALNGHRPAADVLFESVAHCMGVNGVGVLLTGMGADGARGLRTMRDRGAYTIAQDRESSAVYGMPKAAVDADAAMEVAPLSRIASILCRLAHVPPTSGGGRQ